MAATRYSAQGLAAAFRHEEAFRLEVLAAFILVPVGLWLGEDSIEQVLLAGSIVMVLIVELLNSAVEAVVDRVSHEHHELSMRAKDYGSAAVMLALAAATAAWLLVLAPRL
ncbi:MAG: diacylglycerol kinase [Betaproteobacteria bacterium]|nr:diacylglycerol kinase [Betaproteobacteria bacterium]MDH5221947.1 diacylglycerol kinase [Betaproteobacteria bacterium]MDH5349510.1 diacylglycerol kinase [Betaproteobacteria bacterium]